MRLLLPLLLAGCIWTGKDLYDRDGDGVSGPDGDCWDDPEGPAGSGLMGADIGPQAAETWYDGVDQDCAGDDDYDADGDGYVPLAEHLGQVTEGVPTSGQHLGSGDCWDAPPSAEEPPPGFVGEADLAEGDVAWEAPGPAQVYPGAPGDRWYDGVDQDCAGDDDFDQDGDGWATSLHHQADGSTGEDCRDGSWREGENPAGTAEAAVHPGAVETWYDGTDQDCDGNDCDADGDGVPGGADLASCEALDCDDADPSVLPGVGLELAYTGVDEDCDPASGDGDADGDGAWAEDYAARLEEVTGSATPGETVVLPEAYGDCWDDGARELEGHGTLLRGEALTAAQVGPEALDRPYDNVDQDCAHPDLDEDGQIPEDFDWDGDGDPSWSWADAEGELGGDCLDCPATCAGAEGEWALWCEASCAGEATDPAGLGPEAVSSREPWDEPYDGTDQDCDGWNDYDADRDGAVSEAWPGRAEEGSCDGLPCDEGDCDDEYAYVRPGAEDDWYSGADEDCGGEDDFDADGDGYVRDADRTESTAYVAGSGSLPGGDCDDEDAAQAPGLAEGLGDGVDSNCDGQELCAWDADGDGYARDDGLGLVSLDLDCLDGEEVPSSVPATDCDDADPVVNPGSAEFCDPLGLDEDCDGLADDADSSVEAGSLGSWYPDGDGDGWGLSSAPAQACAAPTGHVAVGGDCDDADSADHPGATEVVGNEDDEDCDARELCHVDADDDGYLGSSGATVWSADLDCQDSGEGLTSDPGGDCDDSSAARSPGAAELCDAGDVDEDCDGLADDDDPSASGLFTGYVDADGDAYGAGAAVQRCDLGPGYSSLSTDCDDAAPAIHPAATEVCDPVNTDEDCDGLADDDDPSANVATKVTFYADADLDGHGDSASTLLRCDQPSGYVTTSTDCAPSDGLSYPGAEELCLDGADNDCDGSIDQCNLEASEAPTEWYASEASGAGASLALAWDADADGQRDLFVGGSLWGPFLGRVGLVSSADSGDRSIDSTALAMISGTEAGALLGAHLLVGDSNGDGQEDLLATCRSCSGVDGVLVYWGPLTGSLGPTDAERFLWGASLPGESGLADLDGDGAVDVALGSINDSRVHVWMDPSDLSPSATLLQGGGNDLGMALETVDITGDGLADVVAGARTDDSMGTNAGLLHIWEGPLPRGTLSAADFSLYGTGAGDLVGQLLASGDQDGDGYLDLAIASPDRVVSGAEEGTIWVVEGPVGASRSLSAASATATAPDGGGMRFGKSVAWADLDGDGRDDLLYGWDSSLGGLGMIPGPLAGAMDLRLDLELSLRGEGPSDGFGEAVLGEDIDGDGMAEVVVGDPEHDQGGRSGGSAYLFPSSLW